MSKAHLKKYEEYIERLDIKDDKSKIEIKRSLGNCKKNAPIRALIPFYETEPVKWNDEIQTAYLFVAGVHCTLGTSDYTFQERLRDIYHSKDVTDSMKKSIRNIISMEWDENGKMIKALLRFVNLFKQKGLSFNTAELLHDLCYWNDAKRISKMKWAECIAEKNND